MHVATLKAFDCCGSVAGWVTVSHPTLQQHAVVGLWCCTVVENQIWETVFHNHHHKIDRIDTALLILVMKLFVRNKLFWYFFWRVIVTTFYPIFQSLFASAALAQVGGVLGGPDRPQKQADYAALSHPANTRYNQGFIWRI